MNIKNIVAETILILESDSIYISSLECYMHTPSKGVVEYVEFLFVKNELPDVVFVNTKHEYLEEYFEEFITIMRKTWNKDA